MRKLFILAIVAGAVAGCGYEGRSADPNDASYSQGLCVGQANFGRMIPISTSRLEASGDCPAETATTR